MLADEGALGGGEVEDAEGVAGAGGSDGGEGFEDGVYGEAGVDDFGGGEVGFFHDFGGLGIGDEPVIGWGAEPGGVDFEGVGDDGEDREVDFGGDLIFNAVEEIGVERVGADDGGGLVFADDFEEFALGFAHEGDAGFAEIAAVGHGVDFRPGIGHVSGNEAVSIAEPCGGDGGGGLAGIGHHGVCACGVGGEGKVARGAVVAFAEGGGDDQDARCGVHAMWWHYARDGRCVDGQFQL